ncbi:ribonuclease R [Bacillus sp. M6-12]|nr:ribonuclease R [Bacillus sp. M6-12]
MVFLLDSKSKERKKPIKKRDLERYLKINHEDKWEFYQSLKELEKEEILAVSKRNRISLKNDNVVVGKFYYNPKGYGFIVSSNDKKDVYFISNTHIQHALHEDVVIATILPNVEDSKKEADIQVIIQRQFDKVIGTYIANESFGFVIPDNSKVNMDIYIPQGSTLGANSYDKVICKIVKYPERDRNPEGEIVEVLGLRFERGVDLLSVIKGHNLRDEFPIKVLNQVEKLSDDISEEEIAIRRDLRKETIFTIDGEDSKDLDDAVSIEKLENGHYRLGVHIADVSHYVKENSKVDKEALERGTSVYLVDTVLPMLPFKLSNHLCSLNPNSDKLTLSVSMEISEKGFVVSHEIFESIIRSKAKLHYNEVTAFLKGENPAFEEKHADLTESLRLMEELALILMKKRDDRGNIDFDFPEAKIILNEEGEVENVKKYDRGISNQIIEEFMIVCNETVAETFVKNNMPFMYRTHDNPREEKIKDFNDFIQLHGYKLEDVEKVEPKHLQGILKEVKGKKEEKAVNLILLQSMQQARYYSVCKGHFGLATKFYCHFTSPIRRYPDLQIHRIIKEYLHGVLTEQRVEQLNEIVEQNAKVCSRKERTAQKAEEELYDMKKVDFMRNKIGEEFEGVITGIMGSGFTVTLDNTIEGFVGIHSLKDDEYEFIRSEHSFVGKQTGKRISLGDSLKISVEKVKTESKEIMFKVIQFSE